MNTETYTLPANWASYLINGDHSGMDKEDFDECNNWIQEGLEANKCFHAVSCSDESYFSWNNEATHYGGDVLEYTFHLE
jgi:hypothetical protein